MLNLTKQLLQREDLAVIIQIYKTFLLEIPEEERLEKLLYVTMITM